MTRTSIILPATLAHSPVTTDLIDWVLTSRRSTAALRDVPCVDEADHRQILDAVRGAASRGQSVLDVMCGDGSVLRDLPSELICHGLEVSPVLARRAVSNGVEVRQASFFDAAWHLKGAVDWVVANRVLDAIPTRLARPLLCSLRDLSAATGGVVLTVLEASTATEGWIQDQRLGGVSLWPGYLRTWGNGELSALVEGTGGSLRAPDGGAQFADVSGTRVVTYIATWPEVEGVDEDPRRRYESMRSNSRRDQLNAALAFDADAENLRGDLDRAADYVDLVDRARLALCMPDAGDAPALRAAGSLALKLAMFEESASALRGALEEWPDDELMRLQLGYAMEGLGRFDEALECVGSVIEGSAGAAVVAEARHSAAHFLVGNVAVSHSLDEFVVARDQMLEAARGPDGHKYYNCLGSIHCEIGHFDRAVIELHQALRSPRIMDDEELRTEVRFYLAQALIGSGAAEDALEALDEVRDAAESQGDWDLLAQVVHWQCRSEFGLPPEAQRKSSLYEVVGACPSGQVARSVRSDRWFLVELLALLDYCVSEGASIPPPIWWAVPDAAKDLAVLVLAGGDFFAQVEARLVPGHPSIDLRQADPGDPDSDADLVLITASSTEDPMVTAGAARLEAYGAAVVVVGAPGEPVADWCGDRTSITEAEISAAVGFLAALTVRRRLVDRHVTPRGQAPLGSAPSRTMAQAAVAGEPLMS